jgi:hypothetical protein
MANVALALEALGWTGHWEPLSEGDAEKLGPPPELQPLAKLRIQPVDAPGNIPNSRLKEPTL